MSYYDPYSTRRGEPRVDDEKAWKRSLATAWDTRWHALSPGARLALLDRVKAPTKAGSITQPSSPATGIDAAVLDEIVAAGFVRVEPPIGKRPPRVFPLAETYDFATRVRALRRFHLLGPTDRAALINYARYAFYDQGEMTINRVLAHSEAGEPCRLEVGLELYVTSHRWPGWSADEAKAAAARPLIEALAKAGGPVPLMGLAKRVKSAKEQDVQAALDALIARLAVFEDVDPKTYDLVVGLLPVVRERMAEAAKPRVRPSLVPSRPPTEVASPAGLVTNDLRVFLLEVAGQPPRLRQDGGLFVKEEPRFLEALPAWPDWLYEAISREAPLRVEDAFRWAGDFKFTAREEDERETTLRLTAKGRAWLSSGLEAQYDAIYESFRATKAKSAPYYYDDDMVGDSKFLGIPATAHPDKGKPARSPYDLYRDIKPEHRQALRDAVHRALAELEVGVFYRLGSVIERLAFEDRNPLLLGQDAAKLSIFVDQRAVGRLPERVEAAGRRLIAAILSRRLVPFDAFGVALDADGFVCVARLPRSEGYFGKPYARDESAPATTRVIVQPDFSVIVIGLDPAPAVELAPFCERSKGQVGHGAITFRITRSSVIRAASQGLTAAQMLARLQKHASVDVPENVLHEVRDWAGWIRLVNVRPMTVVRCPDREAADRVASALGRRAERIGEAMVAIGANKLTPAERLKLQEQGVIITTTDITPASAPPPLSASDGVATVPKRPRGRPKKAR